MCCCSTTRRCLLGRVRLRPCLSAHLRGRAPLVCRASPHAHGPRCRRGPARTAIVALHAAATWARGTTCVSRPSQDAAAICSGRPPPAVRGRPSHAHACVHWLLWAAATWAPCVWRWPWRNAPGSGMLPDVSGARGQASRRARARPTRGRGRPPPTAPQPTSSSLPSHRRLLVRTHGPKRGAP